LLKDDEEDEDKAEILAQQDFCDWAFDWASNEILLMTLCL